MPWTAAHQASLSITNSWSLHKLMSIKLVMPSNLLILCCPLLPPLIFPSITVFSNDSALCIRWPKYQRFIFSISPSNEYSGLISFRMDWLDLLTVPGTLKSLLQHHSSVHQYHHPLYSSHVIFAISSVQFISVAQLCPTFCDPMNRSTPGLPVHHQLPTFTQTHVHWVSDAIQPSHPLSSPSLPAPNPSQHQSLFQWVNSSHEVAKVLEFQL